MQKTEWKYIVAALLLVIFVVVIFPNLIRKESVECTNEKCLYNNFSACAPAKLNVEPYDKIGVSTIEISGFRFGKCNYWIVRTPHASDVPQIKEGSVPMDSLTKENFDKIIEEAKNM